MSITKKSTIGDIFEKEVYDNLRHIHQYHPTKRNKDGSRRKLPVVKDPTLQRRARERNWDLRQLNGAQQVLRNLIKKYDNNSSNLDNRNSSWIIVSLSKH